jgi:hypothetical protein
MPLIIISDDVTPDTPSSGDTRDDIVEEILSNIQGFTAAPDQLTSLAADLSSNGLTVKVDSAAGVASGMIEVGEELMWVAKFDDQSGDVQLLPKGRGFRGTKAVPHSSGETVVISPTVPRSVVIREINNQIRALYPSLYAVAVTEFVFDVPSKEAYAIPADTESVLDVRCLDTDGNWERVRFWEVEATPTEGMVLRFSGVPVGRTVRVILGKRPATLSAPTDLFTSSGLSAGAKDLIVLGALARILPMIDVARLGVQHAVADELAQARQLGSASGLAREFAKTFQERLAQEVAALQQRYPARVHFTR